MPSDDSARIVFEDLDDWRTRFLDLKRSREILELSDKEGLPRWLHDSQMDPWERAREEGDVHIVNVNTERLLK